MGKITCKDCLVRQYPACGENIPCCQCKREECNGRQPCPRKEEKKWSLSDARDGDILVSGSGYPFIYNGYRGKDSVGAYCGIDTMGIFLISDVSNYWTSPKNVSLASGTDVNILFRKMNEAGYVWYPEEKILKKIMKKKF